MLHTLFNVVNNIERFCWAWSPQSGVTMLNNIADNIEQCGQQNIGLIYSTTLKRSIFLAVNILCIYTSPTFSHKLANQRRSQPDNCRREAVFIYSWSAQSIHFRLDCFMVCVYEYLNMPPPRNCLATTPENWFRRTISKIPTRALLHSKHWRPSFLRQVYTISPC